MSKIITEPFLNEADKALAQEKKKSLPVLQETGEKAASIHLSGTAITEAGTLTQHKYFDFLGLDTEDYTDISFTPEEALKIKQHLQHMSTGHTAMVPMICSPKCAFRERCAFYKMGKAPYGRQCLIEKNLLREWQVAYIKEYEVDPNSFTEISIINELAEIEVYLWRLSQSLSKDENAELFNEATVGYTPDGIPITNKQISVLLEAKEKLYSRRSRLFKLMVGDRQEKYKKEAALKIKEGSDPSSSMAELKGRLERLTRDIKKKQSDSGEIIDVEGVTPEDLISEE